MTCPDSHELFLKLYVVCDLGYPYRAKYFFKIKDCSAETLPVTSSGSVCAVCVTLKRDLSVTCSVAEPTGIQVTLQLSEP